MKKSSSLLTFVLIACHCASFASERPRIAGWWKFDMPALSLSLLLKISQESDGTFTATEANVANDGIDYPVVPFWCDSRNVRWEIDADFVGLLALRMDDKGEKLEGRFQSGDMDIPLAYTRVNPRDVAPQPALSYVMPPGEAPDIRGYWKGVFALDGAALTYALAIGRAPDGAFHGWFDVFEAGRLRTRLGALSMTNRQVVLENSDIEFTFQGELNPEGTRLSGILADWLDKGPLVLERQKKRVEPELPVIRSEPNSGQVLEGVWDAYKDLQRSDQRVRMQLGRARDGTPLATINNPDETLPNLIPSTRVMMEGPKLRAEWKGRSWEFQGELKDGQLAGTWKEGKNRAPLVFRRVNKEVVQ